MRKISLVHFLSFNRITQKYILLQMLGPIFSIVIICWLFIYIQATILIPSFGSTIILIYSSSHTQAAQPRSILGGHILSSIIGIVVGYLIGNEWLSVTLTLALCFLIMLLVNTTHPPAGGTGLVMALSHQLQLLIIAKLVFGIFVLLLSVLVIDKFILKVGYLDIWFSKTSSNKNSRVSEEV